VNSRLQRLREILRLEWGELADHLGMSRAMLDFVRQGQRNLSFPALRRLEEAERAAGISPPVVTTVSAQPPAPDPAAGMNQEKLEISPLSRDERIAAAIAEAIAALQRVQAILAEGFEGSKPEAGKGSKKTKRRGAGDE
jgi:transcriptional regulator with XRE-family HTH domain